MVDNRQLTENLWGSSIISFCHDNGIRHVGLLLASFYLEFMDKLIDMMKFLIPNYINEGKNQLVIGIGCTGGHHRSVTVARGLYDALKGDESYGLKLSHRDINR